MTNDKGQRTNDRSAGSMPASPLVELKEQLTDWIRMAQADIAELGRQSRWTREQAARLAGCSVSTVKADVKAGRLKTSPLGWILRPHLIEWLGFDPIQEKVDKILSLEKALIKVTAEIEREILNSQSKDPVANDTAE